MQLPVIDTVANYCRSFLELPETLWETGQKRSWKFPQGKTRGKLFWEQTRIHVSKAFLESIEKRMLSRRPAWRLDASMVNTLSNYALLISDHSMFPSGILKENPCIAVEIKPKCGFLPWSRFMAERNGVKKRITRFRMHQVLKLHEGEVSQASEYDPLDLFSGSRDRINRAVKSLFATPQNNFRVFLNGSLVFGNLGGGTDNAKFVPTCDARETFEGFLKGVIHAEHGFRVSCFLELVAETILRSEILGPLLESQKLDIFDIEGAIHAYYDIISQPCLACQSFSDAEISQRYSVLHSLPLEESQKIVRDYLISATAKDCSLMISFRPTKDGSSATQYSSVVLESTNQNFDYKACFIDLDMKPLKKMAQYYELDQKIVSCYTAHMEKISSNPKITGVV